jgi:hypothetical protein
MDDLSVAEGIAGKPLEWTRVIYKGPVGQDILVGNITYLDPDGIERTTPMNHSLRELRQQLEAARGDPILEPQLKQLVLRAEHEEMLRLAEEQKKWDFPRPPHGTRPIIGPNEPDTQAKFHSLINIIQPDKDTLRDWFAGMAMQGMLASPPLCDRNEVNKWAWANNAYAWADAMMQARGEKE